MPSRRSEAGFTLAELLVVSMLTVVVLGGSVKAFIDMRRVSETARGMVDMNQNLRAGLTLMTRDLMQAGRTIQPSGIPLPTGGGSPIKRPAPSTTATFPTTWGTLVGIAPGAGLGPTINGTATDVVTLTYEDPTVFTTTGEPEPRLLNHFPLVTIASNGSSMVVNSLMNIGAGTNPIQTGDLIVFTNAVGTQAIQQVTSRSGQIVNFASGSADLFGLNQRTAPNGTILNLRTGSPAVFPPACLAIITGTPCSIKAQRVVMVSYYIDATTVPSNPRLVRRVNMGTARPISMGVENLQASYDLIDGATNPTNVKTPVAPNSNQQIRNVNLFLGARQTMNIGGEKPLRNGAATQISLRSMSFYDRYQ